MTSILNIISLNISFHVEVHLSTFALGNKYVKESKSSTKNTQKLYIIELETKPPIELEEIKILETDRTRPTYSPEPPSSPVPSHTQPCPPLWDPSMATS